MVVLFTEIRNVRGTRLCEKNHKFNFQHDTFEIHRNIHVNMLTGIGYISLELQVKVTLGNKDLGVANCRGLFEDMGLDNII